MFHEYNLRNHIRFVFWPFFCTLFLMAATLYFLLRWRYIYITYFLYMHMLYVILRPRVCSHVKRQGAASGNIFISSLYSPAASPIKTFNYILPLTAPCPFPCKKALWSSLPKIARCNSCDYISNRSLDFNGLRLILPCIVWHLSHLARIIANFVN